MDHNGISKYEKILSVGVLTSSGSDVVYTVDRWTNYHHCFLSRNDQYTMISQSQIVGGSILFTTLTFYILFFRIPAIHEKERLAALFALPISTISTVVASQRGDNTTWLQELLPTWQHNIYVTDNANVTLSVPRNKGRESMLYLTYIIDNYFDLPDIVIFLHAERYQWHNDDPLYDNARSLSRLRLHYVRQEGYANLQCTWWLGCPHEIRPLDSEATVITNETHADEVYAAGFRYLFPGVEVPESVGVSCCAQFAVARERILSRPREDYKRYREWLMDTELSDDLSGRILEYSWHIVFGKDAVFCPRAGGCYCKLYGLCDLECETEGTCWEQYTLPHYSTMPKNWPWYDWEGNWQNATAM